ncbi:MAG: hypothetical protein VX646_07385 [Verrucomicrobiota bacterium]|nr:hypothetical protein [Verrucomicrobiales bacterium]MCH2025498.1 hypothetical protein [Verrucomicrobiales bacterium]MEC9037607.1 hypothetical protein [Verrucomicrobiota bacterium]MEE2967687.1 hypothetical protein [Verrucomicrobiota bacterium]|tara:strand:+ start:222 stop:665 length:444 start_codon:yes stop_codon:yes gene_type:complete
MHKICLVIFLALACSGCAKYQKQWEKAQNEIPPPHNNLEGSWIGSWESAPSGHGGKLKCIIKESDKGQYEFHYWATWAKVISGGFRITCKVKKLDKAWTFEGDKDLGSLGGNFTHSGSATPNKLKATYKSDRGDHGSFTLSRPKKGN